MEIHIDMKNGKLWLSQQNYVEKIILRFGMNNVKLVTIPLASHFKLSSRLCPSTDEEYVLSTICQCNREFDVCDG
jgi:hypothetical protein